MHVIAAKAVALGEALQPSFKQYAKDVIRNAQTLAASLAGTGLSIISGGTDTHLLLVDLRSKGVTGRIVEASLERSGITCNRNSIPFDPEKPNITSGVRLGTAACTTRGLKPADFDALGQLIGKLITELGHNGESNNQDIEATTRREVSALLKRFPIYPMRDRLTTT